MATRHRPGPDRFEPEAELDPVTKRRLKGLLERIDYTSYFSNKQTMASVLDTLSETRLQRLAAVAAKARADWVTKALKIADASEAPSQSEISALSEHHTAFHELAAAYDELRRMIQRGYVRFETVEDARTKTS